MIARPNSNSDTDQLVDDEDIVLHDSSINLYQKSQFYGYFKLIANFAKLVGSDDVHANERKMYHKPNLVEIFRKSLMPYFPLYYSPTGSLME